MKRTFILGLILIFISCACDKDHSPTQPTNTKGTIQIIVADKSAPAANVPDYLNTVKKPAKSARLDQLEVRVLKSDNSVLASKTFAPSNGSFQVSMTVDAQNDLKVLCLGTINGIVVYCGIDEDVDVQAGKTTSAIISGWNESFIPVISSISPNPSTDGSYTVTWNTAPNATAYVLQEADNQEFSGAAGIVFNCQSPDFHFRKGCRNLLLPSAGFQRIQYKKRVECSRIRGCSEYPYSFRYNFRC